MEETRFSRERPLPQCCACQEIPHRPSRATFTDLLSRTGKPANKFGKIASTLIPPQKHHPEKVNKEEVPLRIRTITFALEERHAKVSVVAQSAQLNQVL